MVTLKRLRQQAGTVEALLSEGYLQALDVIIQLPQTLREEEKRMAIEQELVAMATAEGEKQDGDAFKGF